MANNALTSYKENQATLGYGAAIFYKETGETKYKFLVASETVPFPLGDTETIEYSLVNMAAKGQLKGQYNTEKKDVELLYTRDNAVLFEKLKDRVLDFMSVTPQKIGMKFNGTVTYKPNDAGTDVHKGTYTITPMSIDTMPHFMAREEMKTPIFFADTIPEEISLADLAVDATSVKISVNLSGGYSDAQFSYDTFEKSTNKPTGTPTPVTATNGIIELPKTTGLYIIYAEPKTTDVENYSGCFTTVYVVE